MTALLADEQRRSELSHAELRYSFYLRLDSFARAPGRESHLRVLTVLVEWLS